MRRSTSIFLSSALVFSFICAQPFTGLAKTDTSDPNTEVRKLQVPPKVPAGPPQIPGAKALAELESIQKKNNELFVVHYAQMIKKNPKDSAGYVGRGKAYSGLHDYDKAAVDLDKAIELDPKNVDAYNNRAIVRFMKKDYDGSWKDTHKVEELGEAVWPSFLEALRTSSGRKS